MESTTKAALGATALLAGVVGMFFTFGPALLADCGPDCEARGEKLVAIGAGVVMLGVAALGAWGLVTGLRAMRGGRVTRTAR